MLSHKIDQSIISLLFLYIRKLFKTNRSLSNKYNYSNLRINRVEQCSDFKAFSIIWLWVKYYN